MAAQTDVIDWHEAMQQCGDDEEFLREVLADLRTEVEAQLSIIAEIINVSLILQWNGAESKHQNSDPLTQSRFIYFYFLQKIPNNRTRKGRPITK